MSVLSTVFLFTIAICSSLPMHSFPMPDERGRIRRHRKKNLPRFYDETPSRESFKVPSHLLNRLNRKNVNGGTGFGAGMYGIAGPSYEDGYAALVKYDKTSGNTTTVAVPNGQPLTGESLGCMGPANIFFFMYEAQNGERQLFTGLYPYDLADPTKVYDPIVLPSLYPNDIVGAGDECTSDPNTGDIYAFGHDINNLEYQLLLRVVFNPSINNATITQIGNYSSIDDIPLIAGEITIYDSKRNMLWLAGEDGDNQNNFTVDYFYINASNGDLVKTINFETVPIDTALYNPTLDKIVGITTAGRAADGFFKFEMVYADPQTLAITKPFTPFENDYCSWEAIYSQDVAGGVFYGLIYKLPNDAACATYNGTFLGHLVGVNVNTGSVVTEPQFCSFGYDLTCPWELQYWDDSSVY